jgi:TonB family protein
MCLCRSAPEQNQSQGHRQRSIIRRVSRLITTLLFLLTSTGSLFAQAAPQIFRVSADYAYFTAEKKKMPAYPPEALTKDIGGDVILAVEYSTEGKVAAVQRIQGDPVLVAVCVRTLEDWRFRPIVETKQKANGVTYVGFHFVPATKTVTSSLPFGKWEPQPVVNDTSQQTAKAPNHVIVDAAVAGRNKVSGEVPTYPGSAKHNRIEGQVQLRGFIDKEGNISLLEVIKAPALELAVSAVEAVKTWKYKPYMLNGEPVVVETLFTVTYRLAG